MIKSGLHALQLLQQADPPLSCVSYIMPVRTESLVTGLPPMHPSLFLFNQPNNQLHLPPATPGKPHSQLSRCSVLSLSCQELRVCDTDCK